MAFEVDEDILQTFWSKHPKYEQLSEQLVDWKSDPMTRIC